MRINADCYVTISMYTFVFKGYVVQKKTHIFIVCVPHIPVFKAIHYTLLYSVQCVTVMLCPPIRMCITFIMCCVITLSWEGNVS